MKKFFNKTALTVLLSVLPLTSAYAYTINSVQGNLTGNTHGTILYDFESGTPTGLTGNFTIYTTPSGTTESAPPLNSPVGNDYLSVPNPASDGSATLDFGRSMYYLGLYWGSIDKYNKISFFLNGSPVDTLSGGALPPALGGQAALNQNLYVNISDIVFDTVVFNSTEFAFEIDNIAAAPVPEPAIMLLFGTGLVGLAGVARRRRNSKI